MSLYYLHRGDLNSPREKNNLQEGPSREVAIPFVAIASVTTLRGNVIPCLTQEISRLGVSFLHQGFVEFGEVTLRFAGDGPDHPHYLSLESSQGLGTGWYLTKAQFQTHKSTDS